jgi:hypothetical protein
METLTKQFAGYRPRRFHPSCFYDPEADALTLHFREEEYFAERLDQTLTTYLALSDGELVGCQVKGIRATLEQVKAWGISIQDECVDIDLIFLAQGLLASVTLRPQYAELAQLAAQHRLHASAQALIAHS